MLTPSAAISVACHDPCNQTLIGKNAGSVGMPRDQPAYGLVHAIAGIAGTHVALPPPPPVPAFVPPPPARPPPVPAVAPPVPAVAPPVPVVAPPVPAIAPPCPAVPEQPALPASPMASENPRRS